MTDRKIGLKPVGAGIAIAPWASRPVLSSVTTRAAAHTR